MGGAMFSRRRSVVCLGIGAWLARAAASHAQAAAPMRRIGFLGLLPFTDPPSAERNAFMEGLAALGHVRGRNVEMVLASAENVVDFLDDVARDLVKKRVDIIVGSGGIVLQAAQRATREIPIVMLAVGDPVGMQLVESLARPGANITGSSFISSDLAAKRVQLLRDVAPRARRLAVTFDARNGNARLESAAAQAAAHKLGLVPLMLPFEDDAGLVVALKRVTADRVDLLYPVFEGNIVGRKRFEIADFARARKLPSISGWRGMAEAGALLAYAPDIVMMFRRGAYFVHRIFNGTRPAELPVEQATRFEMVVNLATARAIGVTIPHSIMVSADRVIE